jgi:biopolymer transport protein ExbD
MAGGGGGSDGEPEFQIAPMIDVLLVLLIFFMSITSAQVTRMDSKNLALPIAPNARKKEQMRNEAIVNIRWDAATEKPTYKLEDKEYTDFKLLAAPLKAMKDTSDRLAQEGPKYRVLIRADRETQALVINRVMDVAGQAGIEEIAFGVYNKEGD